jgi:AbrB family looped-hinge helix DNA binding protein
MRWIWLTLVSRPVVALVDALLTLSSKGQLVIPARLRQLLGLRAGDRLALTLESDGLHLVPQGPAKSSSAYAVIGAAHYGGEPVPLERMDPALYVSKGTP